ncbi:unnamed protein product [Owenia fusiformis]|uniref:Uncharacterized protein n=1 Tax=Owenia fusiformis TaxID=6347 RepID=A0A8J1UGV3_OWEFU|nr:unnamed protein product [Owenia fusiformis]
MYHQWNIHLERKNKRTSLKSINDATKTGNNVTQPKDTDEIFQGKLDLEFPSNVKIVRIFTSSTFTDTSHERNNLMERVYPKLKTFCKENGYEFQVVDMRWGVRDESGNDHLTTELCMQELAYCQKLSTGPNFVTFLSHKYGYRNIPRVIDALEFDQLIEAVEKKDPTAYSVLKKWFDKDENSVPVSYILQPIDTHLPDYVSEDSEKKGAAKQTWWEDSTLMHAALQDASFEVLAGDAKGDKYTISVTEDEITRGILNTSNADEHCVWFRRIITDIGDQPPNRLLSRYKDCKDGTIDRDSEMMVSNLASKKISTVLPADSIKEYQIKWAENGVDPANEPLHQEYIDSLCEDFETTMRKMITDGINLKEKQQVQGALYAEIVEHSSFAQDKYKSFQGRKDVLKEIKNYIDGVGYENHPFVVHGQSGSGKTSIMAAASKHCWSWIHEHTNRKGAVILRFIGTTPDSSHIRTLLLSIVQQIKKIYDDTSPTPEDMKPLQKEFVRVLKHANVHCPLVLFLDSLDQFDQDGGGRQVGWLPLNLPDHVKIVVSTLPEAQYLCFPALKLKIQDPKYFLEVPVLPQRDVNTILQQWLSGANRTLTKTQMKLVIGAFESLPLPLHLKLCFDEATRWKSYSKPDETILKATVQEMISMLFARVERVHGKLLVSRTLGYMTLGRSGLTEAELEDILSCDEDVLNDVYQYWTPPVRRLPPLLMVRIKADLQQYIVDRGADGVTVMYWYHRQFVEAAGERYCSNPDEVRLMHSNIADFFLGKWQDGKAKPFVDKSGKSGEGDRLVASQPLKFNKIFNLRKLNELPMHLRMAGRFDELMEHVLFNLDFMYTKMCATSVRSVLEDFTDASYSMPDNADLTAVREAIQLSQAALEDDCSQLPAQISGRLSKDIGDLLKQCMETTTISHIQPSNIMLTQPGGQLTHALNEQADSITITQDGMFAATVSKDAGCVKIWNVQEAVCIQTFENLGEYNRINYAVDDTYIVCGTNTSGDKTGYILLINLSNGAIHEEELSEEHAPYNLMRDLRRIVYISERYMFIYDIVTREKEEIRRIKKFRRKNLDRYQICGGSRYIVYGTGSNRIGGFDMETDEYYDEKELVITRSKPEDTDDNDDQEDEQFEWVLLNHDETKIVVFSSYNFTIHVFSWPEREQLMVIEDDNLVDGEPHQIKWMPNNVNQYYSPSSEEISIIDISTGTVQIMAKHASPINDVAMATSKQAVTLAMDGKLRIWDLTRVDQEQPKENQMEEGTASTKRLFPIVGNDRYIACTYSANYGNKNPRNGTQIAVYDLMDDKMARRIQLVHEGRPISKYIDDLKFIDSTHAVCRLQEPSKKCDVLVLCDMEASTIVHMFDVHLNDTWNDFWLVNDNKEVLCMSPSRHYIRILDIATGCAVHNIAVNSDIEGSVIEDDMPISPDNTLIALRPIDRKSEDPKKFELHIYDIPSRKKVTVFTRESSGLDSMVEEENKNDDLTRIYMHMSKFTKDNRFIIIVMKHGFNLNINEEQQYMDESVPHVVDIKSGKLLHNMADVDYAVKYHKENGKFRFPGIGTDEILALYGSIVLISCNDIMRIYDASSGTLLHRLFGHEGTQPFFRDRIDSNTFVTIENDEDKKLIVWDGRSGKLLASFSTDDDLYYSYVQSRHIDGSIVFTVSGLDSDKIGTFRTLTFKNCPEGQLLPYTPNYDEVFKGTKLDLQLDISTLSYDNIKDDFEDPKKYEDDYEDDDDNDYNDDDEEDSDLN